MHECLQKRKIQIFYLLVRMVKDKYYDILFIQDSSLCSKSLDLRTLDKIQTNS